VETITTFLVTLFGSFSGFVHTRIGHNASFYQNVWAYNMPSCKDIIFLSAMFASMHLFIYEITEKRVVAVLLELLLGISLGYIGGCIYPIRFFPESVKRVSMFLPSGAGIQVLSDGMGYNVDIFYFAVILVYSILFIGGVYVLRNKR